MSVKVISAVMTHSEARLAARLVLLAIADNAEDGSGIAFPPIVDHESTPEHRRRSITFKTRLSEREVRDSLRELEKLGELVTTQAQRGRGRINVYRVVVGYLSDREPAVEDLPFKLLAPFPTTGRFRRQSQEATSGETRRQSGPRLPAEDRGDYRQRTASTTGTELARVRKPDHQQGPSSEPAAALSADDEREWALRYELSLALSAELGARLDQLTRSEQERWQDAIGQLADVGATIADVQGRCRAYRKLFPEAALTPLALVRHWNLCGGHAAAAEAPETLDVEAWLSRDGWRLDPDDIRDVVAAAGLPAAAIEAAVSRGAAIASQQGDADAATRAVLEQAQEQAA